MRSAIFVGAGRPVQIESRPDPTPARDEIVIKVARCGMCGSDVHMTESHSFAFAPGTALGHEFAGEIVALGSEVAALRIGDRVAAMPVAGCGACDGCLNGDPAACAQLRPMMGGFSEYALAKAAWATLIPSSLPWSDGALVEPLACARRTVTRGRMERGSKVLVMGAGAVGLGAVFWARKLGAARIAVAARSEWREAMACKLGADAFIRSDEHLTERAIEHLGGAPDIVIDAIGSPGIIAQAINIVRARGTVVVAGCCTSPDSFIPFIGTMKEVCVQFVSFYTLQDFELTVNTLAGGAEEVRHMITQVLPLEAMPDALESLRRGGRHCKILIDPWSP